MEERTKPPAGWYRDRDSPAHARYWDGTAWTGQTREVSVGTVPAPDLDRPQGTGEAAVPSIEASVDPAPAPASLGRAPGRLSLRFRRDRAGVGFSWPGLDDPLWRDWLAWAMAPALFGTSYLLLTHFLPDLRLDGASFRSLTTVTAALTLAVGVLGAVFTSVAPRARARARARARRGAGPSRRQPMAADANRFRGRRRRLVACAFMVVPTGFGLVVATATFPSAPALERETCEASSESMGVRAVLERSPTRETAIRAMEETLSAARGLVARARASGNPTLARLAADNEAAVGRAIRALRAGDEQAVTAAAGEDAARLEGMAAECIRVVGGASRPG